jgi:hypothetical protein
MIQVDQERSAGSSGGVDSLQYLLVHLLYSIEQLGCNGCMATINELGPTLTNQILVLLRDM